jgi:glycosyltransferase involved in cell wall biosynthesis
MDISVVVCTYNRARLLADTIQALGVQDTPANLNWELILVDNNSTDKTAELISELSANFAVPLRYVFEPQQGKSFALNTGINQSHGEIIAFTDDDVIPEKNWLSSVWQVMTHRGVDGIGGRILPKWEGAVPQWLRNKRHLWGYLAMMDSEEARELALPLVNGAKIWGANMATKRSLFDEIGLFNANRGNVGHKLYRGEETEIVTRALELGKTLVYDPAPVVYHRVGPERMRKSYFRKVVFDGGESNALQPVAVPGIRLLGAPRWLYSIIAKEGFEWLVHSMLVREDAFDRQLDVLDDIGKLWGFWKRHFGNNGGWWR